MLHSTINVRYLVLLESVLSNFNHDMMMMMMMMIARRRYYVSIKWHERMMLSCSEEIDHRFPGTPKVPDLEAKRSIHTIASLEQLFNKKTFWDVFSSMRHYDFKSSFGGMKPYKGCAWTSQMQPIFERPYLIEHHTADDWFVAHNLRKWDPTQQFCWLCL